MLLIWSVDNFQKNVLGYPRAIDSWAAVGPARDVHLSRI